MDSPKPRKKAASTDSPLTTVNCVVCKAYLGTRQGLSATFLTCKECGWWRYDEGKSLPVHVKVDPPPAKCGCAGCRR